MSPRGTVPPGQLATFISASSMPHSRQRFNPSLKGGFAVGYFTSLNNKP